MILGYNCTLRRGYPTMPACGSWNNGLGAFVLAYRGHFPIEAREVGDYWCRPEADGTVKAPSWNPSEC